MLGSVRDGLKERLGHRWQNAAILAVSDIDGAGHSDKCFVVLVAQWFAYPGRKLAAVVRVPFDAHV